MPAGTTSLALGTSSGIHAWHNDYYIRRLRVGKNEPIYKYLSEKMHLYANKILQEDGMLYENIDENSSNGKEYLDAIKEEADEALQQVVDEGIKDQMTATEPPKELREPKA